MPVLTEQERVGTLIAEKYRLDRILGRGGMGVVFAGTHTWTDREVAVKLLNPEFARDAGVVKRFLQEAKTAAGLKHRNVVDVLDMGQADDGCVYLVLEYLHGEPLSARIERVGSMGPGETLELILPVLDALAKAHAKGIVHRDLKPDNIYLSVDSHGEVVPKLLDFGIAKVLDGNASAHTATGTIVGTPYYMSPEQASAKTTLGPPADVWSMGVVLYQCLTGKVPFTADTPTGVLVAILTSRAPSLRASDRVLPEGVAAAVDRSLDPDVSARFKDAGELAGALRAAMPGVAAVTGRHSVASSRVSTPAVPTPPETPFHWSSPGTAMPLTRRKSRVPLIGGAVVALLAAAGLGGWIATRGSDGPTTVTHHAVEVHVTPTPVAHEDVAPHGAPLPTGIDPDQVPPIPPTPAVPFGLAIPPGPVVPSDAPPIAAVGTTGDAGRPTAPTENGHGPHHRPHAHAVAIAAATTTPAHDTAPAHDTTPAHDTAPAHDTTPAHDTPHPPGPSTGANQSVIID